MTLLSGSKVYSNPFLSAKALFVLSLTFFLKNSKCSWHLELVVIFCVMYFLEVDENIKNTKTTRKINT